MINKKSLKIKQQHNKKFTNYGIIFDPTLKNVYSNDAVLIKMFKGTHRGNFYEDKGIQI